ncbi:MAG: peptide deformylase [Peptococcaceae bacterium]|nr:peptide deformylase [Peptococcaceae bacterium]
MAIYKIIQEGDEVLREKAKEVSKINSNIAKLLDNMSDTMYAYKGVGLAAPQVGVSKRVIIVDVGEGLIELINPEIIESSGEMSDVEGCLSVPSIIGEVKRACKVRVTGMNRNGNKVELEAEGYLSRALQHEIDHLNGILFVDLAKNIRRESD